MGATEQITGTACDSRWAPLDGTYFELADVTFPDASQAEQKETQEPDTVSDMVLRGSGVVYDPEAGCPVAAAYGAYGHMGE